MYIAQKAPPSPGDFCQLVDKDRQLLDCLFTDEQIVSISNYDLGTIQEKKAKEEAFRRLMSIKDSKSKMYNICYINPTQPYLLLGQTPPALRTRNIEI